MNIKTKLGLGFGGQILITLALGMSLFLGMTSVKDQFRSVVEHDAPVIANAQRLAKLVVDMETGQRGFIITGKEAFLEPYRSGGEEFYDLLEKEKELVSGNPSQVKALERIEHLVQKWQEKAAQPEIAMAQKVAVGAVDAQYLQDVLGRGVGKRIMDRFMALGHEIESSFSDRQDWEGAFFVEIIEKCMADREDSQRGFLITGKEAFLERYSAGEQKRLPEYFARLRAIVSKRGREGELSKKVDQLEQLAREWTEKAAEPEIAARREMNEHPESLSDVAALLDEGTGKALFDEIRKAFDRFIAIEEELTARRHDSAAEMAAKTRSIAVVLFFVALSFGVAIAVYTSRSISNPITNLSLGAKRVGSGDLDTRVEVGSSDEIGVLSRVFNDMTEHLKEFSSMRNKAEEALLAEKLLSEEYINSLPGLFYVFDEEKFVKWNRRWKTITGYSDEELATGYGTDIFGGEDKELMEERMGNVFHEGAAKIEAEIVTKDGRKIPYYFTGLRKKLMGKNHLIGFGIDITERKQAETEKKKLESRLRRAQKMESIGTLAGGIAHDFNNILTPIIIQTELAKLTVDENDPVQDNLDEVMKAGHRARELVKRILTFSRQSDQQQLPVNLVLIVKESLKLLRSSLPKTIEIRAEIKGTSCTIKADPIQMQEVIMNLCTNAAHAMSEMGSVLEVALEHVELGEDDVKAQSGIEPGNYVMLRVSDTGSGMDKDVIDNIFDPFFTTKEVGKGTGMGLSIVHGIVRSHGGIINVYSEPGEGTTFKVFLPRIEQDAAVAISNTLQPLPTGGERILFVDDEESLVKLGEQMLEKLGYQVESKTSSVEALAAFRDYPDKYDLVMTDMTMPNMTGGLLAKELLQIRSDIPIILCTGFSHQMNKQKALDMGIQAFVMKPYVMRKVAGTIRQVLD